LYNAFKATQLDMFQIKDDEDRENLIELRLFVLHYLMGQATPEQIEDIEGFLKSVYTHYKMLGEMLKEDIKNGGSKDEVFQMPRWTNSKH
jgi:hypothetical protein